MSSLGSWAWAQKTGGRLSRKDSLELVLQGVLARVAGLPGPWRQGLDKRARPLALPAPPDTRLALEAEELTSQLCSPVLYRHCLRTWAFATLFAQRDRVEHDEELLYVACVLHDIGLTGPHDGSEADAGCCCRGCTRRPRVRLPARRARIPREHRRRGDLTA